jgi:hypothetical protein
MLLALEIHYAQTSSMPASTMANSDPALEVSPCSLFFWNEQ